MPIWAKGAYIDLGNSKPHSVLSEVGRNIPAGFNENCTRSLDFSKITAELKMNYNQDNLSRGNFEHFSP